MRKNRFLIFFLLAVTIAGLAPALSVAENILPATGTVQVAFPPDQDANSLIVNAIREARTSIQVQAFSFTSNEIAFALIAAKRRGIDVQLIADAEQMRKLENNKLGLLYQAGVRIWLDAQHQSAHNKVMVIDDNSAAPTIVTGSMNFTYSGQFKNAENLLIMRGNKALAEAYSANWLRHRNHAIPFHP
jgi:phosphatidylserine/phosphatidylglycerophosphate/cardiolipin synthase-like enzyme